MKTKILKTAFIVATISLTTTVFAQMAATNNKVDAAKPETALSESIKNEIKNFEERRKAINEECKKKRDELKANLSPNARKVIEETKEKKRAEKKEAREKREMAKTTVAPASTDKTPSGVPPKQ